jgi:hypothetical protein
LQIYQWYLLLSVQQAENCLVVQAAPTAEQLLQQFNAPQAQPVAVQSNGQAHTCRHGEMAFRSGTSAKGPWKGYMCAAPKGAPDKCDTIWVR